MTDIITRLVNQPIRERSTSGTILGYKFDEVRLEILKRGMRDFRLSHDGGAGVLTPDDLALQYSFINAKPHFFACRQQFETYRIYIESLFATGPVALIDIGCGPATAGMAFAETFPGRNFSYLGIDCAPAMLSIGQRLMAAIHAEGVTGSLSSASFGTTWDGLEIPPYMHVLCVFCYLFASDSIAQQIPSLASFLKRAQGTRAGTKLVTFYLNSTDPRAEENYTALRALAPLSPPIADCSVNYRTRTTAEPRIDNFRAHAVEWPTT